MRRSFTISAVAHVAVLLLSLVALASSPREMPPVQTIPVTTISTSDFTKLSQGVKDAPKLKLDDPKPLADKVDVPKLVDQNVAKISDKPEIKTEAAKQAKPDVKPPDKPAKAKPPDYKPDQIAQLLKQEPAAKPPDPAQTPDKADAQKYDANQIQQLLDHREPTRQVAAAETVNSTANLGAGAAAGATLSQTEIDALRSRISSCWSPPPGIDARSRVYVVLRVLFKPDGSLVQAPVLVEGSASALGPALADSARRALLSCQPFTMLKPEHYDQWKDLELKFDPQELLGG